MTPSVYPKPGGLERFTYYLASSLGSNNTVIVVSLDYPGSNPPNDTGVEYVFPSRWSQVDQNTFEQLLQKIYLCYLLFRLQYKYHFNRIICTWWDPFGYIALVLAKLCRIQYVCVAHGQEISSIQNKSLIQKLKPFLRRLSFLHAQNAVAVSRFTAEKLAAIGIPKGKIKIVPNGLTREYLNHAETFSTINARNQLNISDEKIVLQVGRLVPRKGHDYVLSALAQLGAKELPLRYIIVGDGPNRSYLEEKCDELGLRDRVCFTGLLSEEQLHLYYSAADVVVMPSYNVQNAGDVEGFGIVFLEAYAHGKPVIGSDAGGIPDAIVDQVTGYLIPPGDVGKLAERISFLFENSKEARKLGEQGRVWTYEKRNWEILSLKYLS